MCIFGPAGHAALSLGYHIEKVIKNVAVVRRAEHTAFPIGHQIGKVIEKRGLMQRFAGWEMSPMESGTDGKLSRWKAVRMESGTDGKRYGWKMSPMENDVWKVSSDGKCRRMGNVPMGNSGDPSR